MLTLAEMTDARDRLKVSGNLVEAVRVIYLTAGYLAGARLLNDAGLLISDEIAALDRAIAAAQPKP